MKKYITLLTTVILATITNLSSAQLKAGKVEGTVTSTQKPVEGATISLLKAKDSSLVKMAVTSKQGQFEIEKLPEGKFLVSVSAVGYAKYYSPAFALSAENSVYKLAAIDLLAANKNLSNVTVVTKRPLIEQKIDRTIINVDASPSNTGISALDVLEKSPGISIDKDGNISLKGKQGVMILMDGRPTYLSGQDLANLLRNMPTAQLDQIEIMTNPPAKFDASGNSGVINIKTKKNKANGFNGSVTLGAGMGINPKANNSVNLNYRKGKMNYFGNYSYFYNKGFQDLRLTRVFSDKVFVQQAIMTPEFNNNTFKLGADYTVNKKTSMGVVLNGFYNPGTFANDNTAFINDKLGNLITRTEAVIRNKDKWTSIGGNFNLRHVIDTTGKEITADLDYVNYTKSTEQKFGNYFYDKNGDKKSPDELIIGSLPSDIKIYSARVDYVHPLKAGSKFEAGAKTSIVETDNNARFSNWMSNGWETDKGRSNHFVYSENINAVYVNGSKQFNKQWSGQLGLRLENTNATGKQLTTNEVFKRNYTQLFPTAYVGYTMNKKNQFSLSYGRRINRPNYEDMNPFYNFLDKYTYMVGNPYLKPQFSHNIDLNHIYNNLLTTGFNYSNTTDIIQDVIDQVDSTNTSFVRKSNIANRKSIGLSVSANVPVTKFWRANIYTNLYHNRFSGLVNGSYLTVEGATFSTNVSNQFTFKKGWGAELSGFYRSRSVNGPMVGRGMGMVNFAVSKQVLKNKGSLRLNVRDFLDIQQFRGYAKYQNIDLTIRNQWDNRVVNLSFTYRFGKQMQGGAPRKKASASEEQSRVNTGSSSN